MNYIVGLTGGIGSGKSTIGNMFANLGVPVLDADSIARQLVTKGSSILAEIVTHFGEQVLTAERELNRPLLREIIFNNPQEKGWLDQLMHPAVRQAMLNQLAQQTTPYSMLMVPLLIENQLTTLCDRVLIVDVSPETQLQRASLRDKNSMVQIQRIINTQISREQRLTFADDIICNDRPLHENLANLQQQVLDLHQCYLTLAREKNG